MNYLPECLSDKPDGVYVTSQLLNTLEQYVVPVDIDSFFDIYFSDIAAIEKYINERKLQLRMELARIGG